MSEKFLRALFPHLSGDNGVLLRVGDEDEPGTIWRDGVALPEAGTELMFSRVPVTNEWHYLPSRLFTASGKDLETLLRCPLAPTAVTQWRDTFTAFWVTSDDCIEVFQFLPVPSYAHDGHLCRLIALTPDLVYTRADVGASANVDKATVAIIRGGIAAVGGARTTRELAVIHALRKAGLSAEAIFAIFEHQPIGDPYREHGSVVGNWTIVDELAKDLLSHLEEGKFISFEENGVVWFHLPSVLRWWYPFRRDEGLTILPEKELRLLLREQSTEQGSELGHYIRLPSNRLVPGIGKTVVLGIDLKIAAINGITKGGE